MQRINGFFYAAFFMALGTPTTFADSGDQGWQIHKTTGSLTGQARSCKALSPSVELPLPSNIDQHGDPSQTMRLHFELNILATYGRGFLTPIIEAPQTNTVAYGNDQASLFAHIAARSPVPELAYYFPQEAPRLHMGQEFYAISIAGDAYSELRLVENGRQISSLATIQRLASAAEAGQAIHFHYPMTQPAMGEATSETTQAQLPMQGLEQAYMDVMDCIRIENKSV